MESNTVITLIIAIIGCVIGILSYVRGGNKNAEAQGRMMEKLDQVYDSVKELQKGASSAETHRTQVEERLKTAFNRIEKMEERVTELERKGCIAGKSGT